MTIAFALALRNGEAEQPRLEWALLRAPSGSCRWRFFGQTFLTELQQAQELLTHPDVLTRFQATHPIPSQPMPDGMAGQVTTYLCELAIRSEVATKLHALFKGWIGLNALLLVGLQIRGPRLQRSQLAQSVSSPALSALAEPRKLLLPELVHLGSDVECSLLFT